MSRRQFTSQASSSRATSTAGFGGGFGGFGSTSSSSSTLSYVTEPPNFSSISDPNVVVSFKNLSKKDRATKARGLEDLRSYVRDHPFEVGGGVEEAVLETWVSLWRLTMFCIQGVNSYIRFNYILESLSIMTDLSGSSAMNFNLHS